MRKSAKKARRRIVPCIKSAGPSITTDFTATLAEDWLCTRHTCAKAKIIEPKAMVFWSAVRDVDLAKASMSTPITAPPRMTRIGASNE